MGLIAWLGGLVGKPVRHPLPDATWERVLQRAAWTRTLDPVVRERLREFTERFLADKAGRIGKPLRLRVQLRSFDAVCRMVEAGVGLGIVPETTALRAIRTTAIKIVALQDFWAARDLTHCVRTLGELPPSALRLVARGRESP